jgi:predicted nucleic acid-binding Zn ribbon protein
VRIDDEDRSQDFASLEASFAMAKEILDGLELVRDEANKLLRREKREQRRFLVNFMLTTLGILVTIILGLAALR